MTDPTRGAASPGPILWAILLLLQILPLTLAHDTGDGHTHPPPNLIPLKTEPEPAGPVPSPPPVSPGRATTGQGFWAFEALTNNLLPLPAETLPYIRGAHGTLLVDSPRDTVYWGLENVGWVAFSNRLAQSWVVRADPAFAKGNLHGADLLPRSGKLPLVAVADNVEGEVYVSDTTFNHVGKLRAPDAAPYGSQEGFHPTDVAFARGGELFITDGYGKAYFMPASLDPLAYQGKVHGGKDASQTPHGITYDAGEGSLLVSARPEAQVKRWGVAREEWLETLGLPSGSTVCDVELWGDYALAPCLDGPEQSPGPIYILNLKRRTIVSVLRPKEDLGFADAQHIHDAAWYLAPGKDGPEVYVLFTNWNPGGIGALKLVRRR
jgi:hypothetical protein